ncbi:MAG: glycosyltransferase family 2 protein [Actinomycetota bacterium]
MADIPASDARPDAPSEPRAATPSVTAVVVAHDPGAWFEETLDSIVTQDYPRLELVVVDGTGEGDLGERVRAVAPDATLIDASDTDGFAAAANTVLETDVESAFLLVCHDDVALAPDAVRVLVTEALRSNAGVAGPKLVDWERPEILQHVGLSVDQFAVAADVIEPAERDQEQYDRVRDVFAVPSACVLVRTGLFAAIGGFDPGITRRGEDIDLCWRAQLAGARVLVVPDARVRHRSDLIGRTGVDDIRRTRARHQLRTVLVTGGRLRLLGTIPLLALLSLAEITIAAFTGRFGQVRDIVSAWTWNLSRLGEIRRRRAGLRPKITISPGDVRAAQASGSVRINAFVRGQIGRGDRAFGEELVTAMRTGTTRFSVLAWALVLGLIVFGSRALISDGVPAVGDFVAFPDSGGALIDTWWSSWRARDLGSVGSTPTGFGLLGVLGVLLGGSMGLVRTLWVLGPVVVGLIGAWRVLSVSGSRRAQIATLVAYAALPLPWAAIAGASWTTLGVYAVAPWVLRALLEAQASAPFRTTAGPVRGLVPAAVAAGVAVGLAGVFDPVVAVVTVLVAAGLVAGALVAVNPTGVVRLVAASAGAALVGALLTLPLSIELLANGLPWHPFADGRTGDASTEPLTDLLRFAIGPESAAPLTWAFAVPMAVPLLIGRAWRFDLAVRLWFVALTAWGVALTAVHGVVPFGLPEPGVLVAPAAIAVAALCGVCVSALEHDLRRAGFGWRQLLLPLAIGAAAIAVLPSIGAITDGRWGLGRGGYENVLPLADPTLDGSYRVVWIGHPDHLPAQGSPFVADMAWVATIDGLPDITERSIPADRGAHDQMEAVLDAILAGETSRAGRLLGGLGVRYVVAVERLAPAPFSDVDDARPLPDALAETLDTQLDLRRLAGVNSALRIYENTEWTSVRAAAVSSFDDGRTTLFDLQVAPITGTIGVLGGSDDRIEGPVPDGVELFVAQSVDRGWRLEIDGSEAARRRSFDWATTFVPAAGGGDAVLSYTTPRWRQLVVVVQLLALLGTVSLSVRRLVGGRR